MSNKRVNNGSNHKTQSSPLLTSAAASAVSHGLRMVPPPVAGPTVRSPVNNVSRKKHSIDDIIDHMTADLQSYEGQYIVLGSPHNSVTHPPQIWSEFNSVAGPTAGNTVNQQQQRAAMNQVLNQRAGSHGAGQSTAASHVQMAGQSVGSHPIYLQQPMQSSSYDRGGSGIEFNNHVTPSPCGSLFYTNSATRVQDGPPVANNNGEMIGMVDLGGGNFVNVVFNPPPNHSNGPSMPPAYVSPPQHQTGIQSADSSAMNFMYQHQTPLNNGHEQPRDYGLFGKAATTTASSHTGQSNHQLIDNLVGNWLPNQSGTYSPFGGVPGRVPTVVDKGIDDSLGVHSSIGGGLTAVEASSQQLSSIGTVSSGQRKPRAVAEVRPMRPTYSDVLTKSPPPPSVSAGNVKSTLTTPSSNNSTHSGNSTPKSESRKHNNKSTKSAGGKENSGNSKNSQSSLRRQHSGGSDDNTAGSKLISNIHKWMSIEELTPAQSNSDHSLYDHHLLVDDNSATYSDGDLSASNKRNGSERKQKKKSTKQKVNEEKNEPLNNDKQAGMGYINNNSVNNNMANNSGSSSGVKRSLQINNNLLRGRSNGEKNLPKSKKGGNKDDGKAGLGSANSAKRSQRSGKRRNCQNYIGMLLNKWQHYMILSAYWFINLLWDVMALSSRLMVHMIAASFEHTVALLHSSKAYVMGIFGHGRTGGGTHNNNNNNHRFKGADHGGGSSAAAGKKSWWKFWERNQKPPKPDKTQNHTGLTSNMAIPTTGDEAIRRLLSCKGKDPYSILGVTPTCSDDEIKKYYKRQAVLVHPDKNSQPGAEEAFKILVHAFELIGEPDRRSRYDHCVAETHQMETAWSELNDLLTQLHQKMEYTANTIRCTNCGKRHRRVSVPRPCYAARFCAQCKIHHSAREGDIWAESWIMGFVWHYYACMEGQIYNITEWASCQADNLQHLKANSHSVQYRIVLGKQQHNQQQTQQHEAHQQTQPAASQQQRQNEPDLEEFLNNLYSQSSPNQCKGTGDNGMSRNRRKTKRKK